MPRERNWVIVAVSFSDGNIDDVNRIIGPYLSEGEALYHAERMAEKKARSKHATVSPADELTLNYSGSLVMGAEVEEILSGFIVKRLLLEEHSR